MSDNESSPGDARVSAAEMPSLSGLLSLAIAVVVVATLYLARDLFVPFTLAVLLSFVLAPFVRILRWARLPHRPAAVIAVLFALAVILAVGGVIGTQIASLAEDLPRYETTIRQKVDTVHSAHVGQDLEVHYRWHPCFGSKVHLRQVQEWADGRYVRVQIPTGAVVLMPSWMLDPLACAAMTAGPPKVDWAALIELKRLLIDVRLNKVSPPEAAIVQEDRNEDSESPNSAARFPSVAAAVRNGASVGTECRGAEQDQGDSGANLDAGRRARRRGAWR